LSKEKNPKGFSSNEKVAQQGGEVAKVARKQLESKLGHSVISSLNAKKTLNDSSKEDKKNLPEK
jgi:hypothetical protein